LNNSSFQLYMNIHRQLKELVTALIRGLGGHLTSRNEKSRFNNHKMQRFCIHSVSKKARQISGAVVSSNMVQCWQYLTHNQHTLENDVRVSWSLCIHFYLFNFPLKCSDSNDAINCTAHVTQPSSFSSNWKRRNLSLQICGRLKPWFHV